MRVYFVLLLILASFTIQGCVPKYGGKTIHTSQEQLDEAIVEKRYRLIARQAEADIGNNFFVYLPVKIGMPNTEDQIESMLAKKLLDRHGADLLTNVKIEQKILFTLYWNTFSRHITADVWRKKD